MSLELTPEQEKALTILADREIAAEPLRKALDAAEAALTEVEERFNTDRAVAEAALTAEVTAGNLRYAAERAQKASELEDAKRAIESTTAAAAGEVKP